MTVSSLPHAGPSDCDPLTPGELDILLAIPRAAQSSPNSLLFRLPKGDHPSMGYVDLTCFQTCSLVSRLAASWRTRLSTLLSYDVGPGTTVCVMATPHIHGIFHHLAILALGCTVQFVSQLSGTEALDNQLRQSKCQVVVYCGNDDAWARDRKEQLGTHLVELPQSEYSHRLAEREVSSPEPSPEWPTPRRPSPAVIIQSSATTGKPKVMSFSLYFYTLGLAWNCDQYLAQNATHSDKAPRTHPRLIFAPPFWASFHRSLTCNLVTATPVCLLPGPDRSCISSRELAAWMGALDVGSLVSTSFSAREIILSGEHIELLQSLHSITMIGSIVDEELSDSIIRNQLNASNVYGMSELGRLFTASQAPYTHLRPCPDFPPPIAVPLPTSKCVGDTLHKNRPRGREVELWYLVDSFPQLAHIAARGGVPLKLSPFPGIGPAHGKLAVNIGDVFWETDVPNKERDHDREVAYMHLGRTDDYIRLVTDDQEFNASHYESLTRVSIESELTGSRWRLDSMQLFGTGFRKTALVVQLQGQAEPDESTVRKLRRAVEIANHSHGTAESARVDPSKRMLVVTCCRSEPYIPSGTVPIATSPFAHLRLSYTHKHTLRRNRNVEIFGSWLEQLDWD